MIKINSDEIGVFLGDYYCNLVEYILLKNKSTLYTIPKNISTLMKSNDGHLPHIREWLSRYYRLTLEDAPVIQDKDFPFLNAKINFITDNCIDLRFQSITGRTGILVKFSSTGFANHTEERYKAEALLYLQNNKELSQVAICRVGVSDLIEQEYIARWTIVNHDDLEPIDEIKSIINNTYKKYFQELEQFTLEEKEKIILSLQNEIQDEQKNNRVKSFMLLGTKVATIPHSLYEELKKKREEKQLIDEQINAIKDQIMGEGDIDCVIFTDKGKKIANIFSKKVYYFDDKQFKKDYPLVYQRYFKPSEKIGIWFEDWRTFI